jgi:hypothetical protein
MEVPPTLFVGEDPHVIIEEEARWLQEPFWTLGGRCLVWKGTPFEQRERERGGAYVGEKSRL